MVALIGLHINTSIQISQVQTPQVIVTCKIDALACIKIEVSPWKNNLNKSWEELLAITPSLTPTRPNPAKFHTAVKNGSLRN